jgi:hypothetical protein
LRQQPKREDSRRFAPGNLPKIFIPFAGGGLLKSLHFPATGCELGRRLRCRWN